nr:MAG: putative ATPase, RNase L inhibitor RLI [Candidatus Nanosalinarum sp. J07AB56]
MSDDGSQDWIVVVDQEKLDPEIARQTVVKYDPLNRSGKEGGFRVEDGQLTINQDKVMGAHRTAVKRYPEDGVVRMVRLEHESGDPVHQFGDNSFRLYDLPRPDNDAVVGMLGRNGTGKSVSMQILSGGIRPNLGRFDDPPAWPEIRREFRGTGLQDHIDKLAEDNVDAAVKPQHVERIPEQFSGQVEDLLKRAEDRGNLSTLAERLEVGKLFDRDISELSGGELQRVAICSTLAKQADLYVFDEPGSFLDVRQRLRTSRTIRDEVDAACFVVEHDLAALDAVADRIHVLHGDPGAYGDVSNAMNPRDGINQYLDGYLESHNLRIRSDSIEFDRSKRSRVEQNRSVTSWPEMTREFGEDGFRLEVDEGAIHEEEVMGILGENGLGKTVFTKMLAGAVEPDEGEPPEADISYKPQRIEAENESVQAAVSKHVNPDKKSFQTRVAEPLNLDPLMDRNLTELSGGELQRVAIAICLARDAELYLLDEPSAYLDVESRVELGKTLKRFARKSGKPVAVVDHDLLLVDYLSDRAAVFTGKPGVQGHGSSPQVIDRAMDSFLEEADATFRRDPDTGRPRANKPGSQKDRSQREAGEYYEN